MRLGRLSAVTGYVVSAMMDDERKMINPAAPAARQNKKGVLEPYGI